MTRKSKRGKARKGPNLDFYKSEIKIIEDYLLSETIFNEATIRANIKRDRFELSESKISWEIDKMDGIRETFIKWNEGKSEIVVNKEISRATKWAVSILDFIKNFVKMERGKIIEFEYQPDARELHENFRPTLFNKRFKYIDLLGLLYLSGIIISRPKHYSTGAGEWKAFKKTIKLNKDITTMSRRNIFQELELETICKIKGTKTKGKEDLKRAIERNPHEARQLKTIWESKVNIDELFKSLTKEGRNELEIRKIIRKADRYNEKVNFSEGTKTDEGRFYSSACFLNKEARQFLELDGKKFIEIDVKNSQPLLLSKLINHKGYKEDVQAGVFYDKLARHLGKTKDETKKLLYKYIFFNEKPLKSGKLKKAMNELWDGFLDQLNRVKGEYNGKLWKPLQEKEAEIFVKKLGRMVDFNYITIHDSVLVLENDKGRIINIILDLYTKEDLKPQLSIK
jgi:hypothetical protein